MGYHVTGLISTVLFLLSMMGLCFQLQKIWQRKNIVSQSEAGHDKSTAVLSLNFFSMAFLAFYLMFVYGFSLGRFNHYLVWSRLVALLITLMILYEIMIDRKERYSTAVFIICAVATVGSLLVVILHREIAIRGVIVSQALIVFTSITMSQGNIHQIFLIRRSGSTGAVSLKSHQLTLLKDLGTVAFGIVLGLGSGWPLLVASGSNGFFRLLIIWHFRWVRLSRIAEVRRELTDVAEKERAPKFGHSLTTNPPL